MVNVLLLTSLIPCAKAKENESGGRYYPRHGHPAQSRSGGYSLSFNIEKLVAEMNHFFI